MEEPRKAIPKAELSILRSVGRGSFGAVFEGRYLNTAVAIKQIFDANLLEDEAKRLSKLHHPNIVQYIGECTDGVTRYLVTEFVNGGTLASAISSARLKFSTISPSLIHDWLKQLTDGLQYLHYGNPTVKVIHRDLKPDNILLSINGLLKIADLGCSTEFQASLRTMTFAGSFKYMAPEVIRHAPSNELADVYSFGVVAWEMITRQEPYGNIHPITIAFIVGNRGSSLPVPADLPASLKHILQGCLQHDHTLRPNISVIRQEVLDINDCPNALEFENLVASWQPLLVAHFESFASNADYIPSNDSNDSSRASNPNIGSHLFAVSPLPVNHTSALFAKESALLAREQDIAAREELIRQKELDLAAREASLAKKEGL